MVYLKPESPKKISRILALFGAVLLLAAAGGFGMGKLRDYWGSHSPAVNGNLKLQNGESAAKTARAEADSDGSGRIRASGGPTSCSACHRSMKPPENHKKPDWGISHGINFSGSRNSCNQCHGYNTNLGRPGDFKEFDLTQLTGGTSGLQSKVSCARCHSPGHQVTWIKEHIPTVKDQGLAQCKTCHSLEGCTSCHRARVGK